MDWLTMGVLSDDGGSGYVCVIMSPVVVAVVSAEVY
jgi:hypothetical protein